MSLKIEAITMIPSLILLLTAIYLSMFSLITIDPSLKKLSVFFALCLFFGGVAMAICWILYWAVYEKLPE
jgi:uncharacterized membrane protein